MKLAACLLAVPLSAAAFVSGAPPAAAAPRQAQAKARRAQARQAHAPTRDAPLSARAAARRRARPAPRRVKAPAVLAFPKDDYTLETETITTAAGPTTVTCRFYERIVYVQHPVSAEFESLDVAEPVEIDGRAVDSADAPIVLDVESPYWLSNMVAGGLHGGGWAPGSGGPQSDGLAPGRPGTAGGPTGSVETESNPELALAAGYVVVTPGLRGRDNVSSTGTFFGKAPAAIVDLKAVVKYLHHNRGIVPGNPNRIVATGTSGGGALSALLGASIGSSLYAPYLDQIGAAPGSDSIYASAAYSPVTDLDHADMSYEWEFGSLPYDGRGVDQTVSRELREAFGPYEASLHLRGRGFGEITVEDLAEYILREYLEPAARIYLELLPAAERSSYLARNPWITWSGGRASFTWASFIAHVGYRDQGAPAFDGFDLEHDENGLFGDETTDARHFTLYSLRHATGDPNAQLEPGVQAAVDMMNPMYFLEGRRARRARYWFLRTGAVETETSLATIANLGALLEDRGGVVNRAVYWDAGHNADEDPQTFITWVGSITGRPPFQ